MILITEFMDEVAVASLAGDFEIAYDPALADDQSAIPAQLTGRRALIVRNRTKVTADLLAAAPDLECVGRLGVGLDNIDLDACKSRGVTVYPAIGANTLSVAEYVLANSMMLLRGAYHAKPDMLAGAWPRQACAGREIAGAVLGLVGFGAIARRTADMARALGMRVTAHDPYLLATDAVWEGTENLGLDELLAQADVVSLHIPLTETTRYLIDAARLAVMKDDAVLINAARGGVVDEAALADALRAGKIGGAALDVFENEPLDAEAAAKFADLPNIVLTPHIAGVTVQSNIRVSAMIADVVGDHLRGAALAPKHGA